MNSLVKAGIAVSAIGIAVGFVGGVSRTAHAEGPFDFGTWQPSATEQNFDLSALAMKGFAAAAPTAAAAAPPAVAPPPASPIEAPVAAAPAAEPAAAVPSARAAQRSPTLTLPATGTGARGGGDEKLAIAATLACAIAGIGCAATAGVRGRRSVRT